MKVVVTTSHRSKYPEPIGFAQGELVSITDRRDTEFPGWLWVKTADENEGWAPEEYLEIQTSVTAVAIKDYSAKELDTEEGEMIEPLHGLAGWIWSRNQSGDEGWVPAKTLSDAC